jgi:hypothetical protein
MYIGTQPYSGIRARHTYTATAGQTSFSGAGAENVTLTYSDELYIDVYQNGVKLSPADYTATSGTTVVLGTGASVSDIVEVVKYDAFSVADTVSAKDGGGFGGDVSSSGTFLPTGDTAAGDAAAIGFTSAEGLILTGQGSTSDITVKNDADATVMQILTGTDDVVFTDDIDLNSDGARITFGGSSETIILEHVADTGLKLQGSGTNTNFSLLAFHTSNGTVPDLRLGKSSNNTVGTFAETANGEALGQIRFTGQDSNNATREGAMIAVDQSASSTGSTVPSIMKFSTTGTESFRIDSNNHIYVNNDGASPLNGRLSVYNDTSNDAIKTYQATSGTTCLWNRIQHTASYYAIFRYQTSTVGSINTNGSATAYNTSSDHRLKESVSYDFDATSRLKQLKPCRFNWIADENNKTVDGFIAHEVSDIVPEAITGEKDAMAIETSYTEDDVETQGDNPTKSVGDVKTYSTTEISPQGIDQSKLVPLLVKSLQEALTEIDTLKTKVAALEGE